MRILLIVLMAIFLAPTNTQAQVDKKLYDSWLPTQWEIYNTVYKKRYWDRRDNYDYITFKANHTFQRRYQGQDMTGTWKYNKSKKVIELTVTKPFKKTITLRVLKMGGNELEYQSSEEEYKVTMTLKPGTPPVKPTHGRRKIH